MKKSVLSLIMVMVFCMTATNVFAGAATCETGGKGESGTCETPWYDVYARAIHLRGVEYTWPATSGSAGQSLQTDGAGTLSWGAAGAATAWDDLSVPDANESLDMTTYSTTWDFGGTVDMFTLEFTGNFADVSGMVLEQKTGNPTNGTIFEIKMADTDPDFVSFSVSGSEKVNIADDGATTLAGTAEGTDVLTLTAGDLTITDGDLNVDGGDVVFAEDFEVNGVITLENDATIDNASNNIIEINENSEELKITFANNVIDWSSSTGVATFDMFDGSAATIQSTSNGAADDFTLALAGATDSSLILSSSGTAADALQISTSAGGIDIAVVGSAAGEDLNLDSDSSIVLTASEAGVADAVVIQTDGAASGIDIISLADIDITTTGAAGEDITILNTGGSVNITGSEADAAAIVIDASDAAGGMDIDAGTGGIAVDITGAGDFRVDSSGGSVVLVGAEAAADAITIDAENAAGGIDIDYGTGNMVITGSGASADFTLDADLISIDGTGTSNITFTNGAAEDVTISTAGAADHSLIIQATGTAADAMQLITTAGGITITNGGAAAGEDFTISNTNASMNISAAEDVEDAIVVNASTGGINITADGAAASDLDLVCTNGSTNISGGEAVANAVTIAAGAGGVDISSAATFDIDITATGGRILGVASEAAADQFKIDAQGTVVGDAINLETTDGGIMLNADGSENGDIELNSVDDMILTSGGDLTVTVTGTTSFASGAITDVLRDSEAVSAADSITVDECGKTFYIAGGTEYDLNLPTLAAGLAGCEMTFILAAAPAGDDYRVETGNSLENQIFGVVVVDGAAVQGASEDTITFADGAAAVGDWVTVESDGTNWYVRGQGFAAGSITLTAQD